MREMGEHFSAFLINNFMMGNCLESSFFFLVLKCITCIRTLVCQQVTHGLKIKKTRTPRRLISHLHRAKVNRS